MSGTHSRGRMQYVRPPLMCHCQTKSGIQATKQAQGNCYKPQLIKAEWLMIKVGLTSSEREKTAGAHRIDISPNQTFRRVCACGWPRLWFVNNCGSLTTIGLVRAVSTVRVLVAHPELWDAMHGSLALELVWRTCALSWNIKTEKNIAGYLQGQWKAIVRVWGGKNIQNLLYL